MVYIRGIVLEEIGDMLKEDIVLLEVQDCHKGSLTNLTPHAEPVVSCISALTINFCIVCALMHDITCPS